MDENLNSLGFSAIHKQFIYMVLSAILNLGNIEFSVLANDDKAAIETYSRKFLRHAAALLKLDESDLESILINRIREIGDHRIK